MKKDSKKAENVLPTYESWTELPHIPVSLGIKGSIGKTGEWRTFRPVLVQEKCNKCGFCYVICPEGTVRFSKEEGAKFDLVYCKGCGICARECPKGAIEMKRETEQEDDQ